MSSAVEVQVKKTSQIRISDETLQRVRIASGYTDEQATEYVDRVLRDCVEVDTEDGHKALAAGKLEEAREEMRKPDRFSSAVRAQRPKKGKGSDN